MLTTLDVAKGMQRKHSKLIRDIDRVRSILPPDFDRGGDQFGRGGELGTGT